VGRDLVGVERGGWWDRPGDEGARMGVVEGRADLEVTGDEREAYAYENQSIERLGVMVPNVRTLKLDLAISRFLFFFFAA
jgi:hypothetical protein